MSAEVPLALVGIGCKFPGGSDTKDLYYEFLRNKVRDHDSLLFSITKRQISFLRVMVWFSLPQIV